MRLANAAIDETILVRYPKFHHLLTVLQTQRLTPDGVSLELKQKLEKVPFRCRVSFLSDCAFVSMSTLVARA
jgi:hypothetical protein